MKIALIDPSLFTWPYDRELAGAMAELGQDPKIFGKAQADDAVLGDPLYEPLFYRSLASPALARLPATAMRFWKGLSHATSMQRLAHALEEWRPDVIHFQWLPLPVIDKRFLKRLRRIAPLVLTVHDTLPFNGTPGSRLQNLGAIDIWRAFDRLIVHTRQGETRLLEQGIPFERIARIAHGLLHGDATLAQPAPAIVAGPAVETPVELLLFGRIKPYKGVDSIIRALGRLPEQVRRNCRVRIAGKPYMDVAPLYGLAEELGVTDSIQFDFRFIPDQELAGLMAQADGLLFPYHEIEASGVLMATIAHGRPLIASRLGAFAELIEDGESGLLVPPGDDEALAMAMERFILDAELRRRTTAGMDRLRRSIPSWEDISLQTLMLYTPLLGGRDPEWRPTATAKSAHPA